MPNPNGFNDVQQQYLQGLARGLDLARAARGLTVLSGADPSANGTTVEIGPRRAHREAQDRFLAAGKTLSKEEQAKREKDGLALWDEIRENAAAGRFPKGTDVFLYKFSGLFHVAPAQDAFMCRLRIPGGAMPAWQFRGVADLARRHGGGSADVTTRANLQIREIGPEAAPHVLTGLADLGLIVRGSGADNVRNVTASPTSGFDPQELVETLPLAKEFHHYLLNHPELYGLPRKFNVAFEGGGRVASLDDTNDIGYRAVRVTEPSDDLPEGIYFRLALGGITGHKDFARPSDVLLKPNECTPVAAAILRVFLAHGDRTDRRKARLKYLLDAWGHDRFLAEVEKEYGSPLRRVAPDRYEEPAPDDRWAHFGFHPQRQEGRSWAGVVLPVGRLTADQMDGLAAIAERFGSGSIRLTVWQNLLIPDIGDHHIPESKAAIEALGLGLEAGSIRAGLVACTGRVGCKYGGADTKGNAMALARYLEGRVELDRPVNVHLTGCHHSCAQHYIGDIGLEATKVEVGEEMVEGYHLCVGGGWGAEQAIGRRLLDSLPFDDVPPAVERLLRHYLDARNGPDESFAAFANRVEPEELWAVASDRLVPA